MQSILMLAPYFRGVPSTPLHLMGSRPDRDKQRVAGSLRRNVRSLKMRCQLHGKPCSMKPSTIQQKPLRGMSTAGRQPRLSTPKQACKRQRPIRSISCLWRCKARQKHSLLLVHPRSCPSLGLCQALLWLRMPSCQDCGIPQARRGTHSAEITMTWYPALGPPVSLHRIVTFACMRSYFSVGLL